MNKLEQGERYTIEICVEVRLRKKMRPFARTYHRNLIRPVGRVTYKKLDLITMSKQKKVHKKLIPTPKKID